MLYPEPGNLDDPSLYLVVGYLCPEIPLDSKDVIIPYYPEKGEMVLATGESASEPWLGHIQKLHLPVTLLFEKCTSQWVILSREALGTDHWNQYAGSPYLERQVATGVVDSGN